MLSNFLLVYRIDVNKRCLLLRLWKEKTLGIILHCPALPFWHYYSQPVDLNLDEETLMRIVPFWRTSLSDSKSQSRQFYFDRFEIQPIKVSFFHCFYMSLMCWLISPLILLFSLQFDLFLHFFIKIIANFLPGDSNLSYSSAQETLRSLLHSVIKVWIGSLQ